MAPFGPKDAKGKVMRHLTKVFAVLAALCVALALGVCGGDDRYAAAGTYKLHEIQSPTSPVDADTVQMLEVLGKGTTLELRADGTGTWTLVGVPADITWENTTLVVAGQQVTFTISGNQLIMEADQDKMIFQKS